MSEKNSESKPQQSRKVKLGDDGEMIEIDPESSSSEESAPIQKTKFTGDNSSLVEASAYLASKSQDVESLQAEVAENAENFQKAVATLSNAVSLSESSRSEPVEAEIRLGLRLKDILHENGYLVANEYGHRGKNEEPKDDSMGIVMPGVETIHKLRILPFVKWTTKTPDQLIGSLRTEKH